MPEDEPQQPAKVKKSPDAERLATLPSAGLFRNPISWIGSVIAVVSLANVLFLLLIDFFGVETNPYVGILAYMVLPGFLLMGLAIIPVGMLIERKRRRRRVPEKIPPYPRIDLNQPRQRNALAFIVTSALFFLLLSAVGTYRGYEYTETTEFCGALCHTVMHPEYTAYQASPHARVACVDCHVGPGAGWYVESKLSGVRQIFKTAMNTFPRPIPTPVANLRPAQATCEQCHWPEKFHGAQLMVFTHFAPDERNTPRQITMLIKTGGGSPTTGGLVSGIHWHMNIANEVIYAATDDKRQVIPWVRIKDMQGRVTEYLAQGSELTPEQIAQMPKRRMDCIDCHNRPSHIYVPPDRSVDQALLARRLDPSLPYIKKIAAQVLTAQYETTPQAMEGIATEMDRFYHNEQPGTYRPRHGDIEKAIAEVQRIFRTTTFPEMKVNWETHPNNIGHFYFPGCFRCHDGEHVSKDGEVIRKDCEICHTVLSQEEAGQPMAIQGGTFTHPVDLGDMTAYSCIDCHSGAGGP